MIKKKDTFKLPKKNGTVPASFKILYRHSPPPKEIPPEGLSLLEMPDNGCKYSINTDKCGVHLFCSKPKVKMSYCQEHFTLMYQKGKSVW